MDVEIYYKKLSKNSNIKKKTNLKNIADFIKKINVNIRKKKILHERTQI